MEAMTIEPLAVGGFDAFVDYLADQLTDNGSDASGYFQPVSREDPSIPPAKVEAFRAGLVTPVPLAGWRRGWVARVHGFIVGHVDLRAHPEPFTAHRCLLGMGVHRQYRRAGIGRRLLDVALAWGASVDALEWVDLEVFSTNAPAIRLYEAAGFKVAGELPDFFRIDGHALGSRIMCRGIRSGSTGHPA